MIAEGKLSRKSLKRKILRAKVSKALEESV